MQIKKYLTIIFISMTFAALTNAQNFKVEKTGVFQPQNKKVLLLQDNQQRKLIVFKAPLAVNTDGSPTSYNPQDARGKVNALNTVCNAIAVYKVSETNGKNLCVTNGRYTEAINTFEKWRDSGYLTVPNGYRITWKNVLAATKDSNGNEIPCVFSNGIYKGFFGSLTNLQNGLPDDQQGECQAKNQLDSLEIPHLVLAGGANPVKTFGAKVGDLLVAFNPANNQMAFAIIGDTGPANNLGEGSVALNMTLLKKQTPPKNKQDTYNYAASGILIAIIPATVNFNSQKPFTAQNIADRIKEWQRIAGFNTPEDFIKLIKTFESKLN